jgi:hypothetical protein
MQHAGSTTPQTIRVQHAKRIAAHARPQPLRRGHGPVTLLGLARLVRKLAPIPWVHGLRAKARC